jgi:hypothetical protein
MKIMCQCCDTNLKSSGAKVVRFIMPEQTRQKYNHLL